MRWWTDLQAAWMPGDPVQPTESRRQRYEAMRDIVTSLAPETIFEIGVRAGYSAFAMLSAAPEAFYIGIDADNGTHGGVPGGILHARKILRRFPHVAIWAEDSHAIGSLSPPVGLLHIDGDHSYDGCRSDLDLGLRSRVGHMLVDDVDYIPDVRRAVDDWLADHPEASSVDIHDGHHGMTLIGWAP